MKNIKTILLSVLLLFLTAIPVFAAGDISIKKDNGIYHIILKGESVKKRIKFVSSEDLITNREAHLKSKSTLTVNAGFFDPKNAQTTSYIVTELHQLIQCLIKR